MFDLVNADTGQVLDTVTYGPNGMTYSTGRARSIVEARIRRDHVTEVVACERLARGWTNGYRETRSHG
jgi:hypothetical protein